MINNLLILILIFIICFFIYNDKKIINSYLVETVNLDKKFINSYLVETLNLYKNIKQSKELINKEINEQNNKEINEQNNKEINEQNNINLILDNNIKQLEYNFDRFKTHQFTKNIILKNDNKSKVILTVSKFVQPKYINKKINTYLNEKKWLNILKDTNIIAKPIHFDDENKIIITEYGGEKIDKYNIPYDYQEQINNILKVLKKNNCRHNDIKPDELIVLNGKIRLIDFGWAHELNQDNPDFWPPLLGGEFKCNISKDENGNLIKTNQGFDDKCSIMKSINFVY